MMSSLLFTVVAILSLLASDTSSDDSNLSYNNVDGPKGGPSHLTPSYGNLVKNPAIFSETNYNFFHDPTTLSTSSYGNVAAGGSGDVLPGFIANPIYHSAAAAYGGLVGPVTTSSLLI